MLEVYRVNVNGEVKEFHEYWKASVWLKNNNVAADIEKYEKSECEYTKADIKCLLRRKFDVKTAKGYICKIAGGSIGPMTSFPEIAREHTNTRIRQIKEIAYGSKFTFKIEEQMESTYKASEGYDPSYMTTYIYVSWGEAC